MRTRRRYPVVAMRAQVVLPGGVARFDLSRSRTVAAVEEAMVRDGLIFLVAQKNPEELDPGVSGTYRYGTLCQIRSLTRTSRDTRRAMLFGIRRCSVEQLVLEGDIYEAELYNAPLREIEKDGKEKEAMLRALKAYAAEEGIPLWVSMEERMACGIGACLGCITESAEVDPHSNVKNKRVCADGPVFRAEEVVL